MALLCSTLPLAPIPLVAGVPPPVIPPSLAPLVRGPAINVTSDLKGLAPPDDTALDVQRVIVPLEYEWTSDPEYPTPGLTVDGPAPGVHTHTVYSNRVLKETLISPEAEGTPLV